LQKRIPRAVCDTGESELRLQAPFAASAAVVQSALSGSGEDPRPVTRRGGQVPAAQEVPTAKDHLGRRGDRVLFQGEAEERAEGLLPEEQVPDTGRKTRACPADGPDAHASQQLVQKPATARPDAPAAQVSCNSHF